MKNLTPSPHDPAPKKSAETGMQTISRAAAVLRAVETAPGGLSLGELAKELSLPRSTVQRLVDALKLEGFLVPSSARQGVQLGPILRRMANAAEWQTARYIRPLVTALSARLNETVDVSIHQGGTVVFVDQVTSRRRLIALSAVGESFPLFVSAPGKALLAHMSDRRAEDLFRRNCLEFPDWPAPSWTEFHQELEQCRRRGYALDLDRHNEGISAVGTLLEDNTGIPLMISIPSPSDRFERNKNLFINELIKTRNEAKLVLKRIAASAPN